VRSLRDRPSAFHQAARIRLFARRGVLRDDLRGWRTMPAGTRGRPGNDSFHVAGAAGAIRARYVGYIHHNAESCSRCRFMAPRTPPCGSNSTSSPATSLPDVVQWFKSLTTARYRQAIRDSAWYPFGRRLWQRNYYERVIRNDDELFRIREYIVNNPKSWECDRENPDRIDENDIYKWLYS